MTITTAQLDFQASAIMFRERDRALDHADKHWNDGDRCARIKRAIAKADRKPFEPFGQANLYIAACLL